MTPQRKKACIKLSEIDQDVFSSANQNIIFPVDNKWGKQGWTFVELKKIKKELFVATLITSYCHVAPKFLADQIKLKEEE